MLENSIRIIGDYIQINRLGLLELYGDVFEKLNYLASKDKRNVNKNIKYETIIGEAINQFLKPELKQFRIKPYVIPAKQYDENRRILQKQKDHGRDRDIPLSKMAKEKPIIKELEEIKALSLGIEINKKQKDHEKNRDILLLKMAKEKLIIKELEEINESSNLIKIHENEIVNLQARLDKMAKEKLMIKELEEIKESSNLVKIHENEIVYLQAGLDKLTKLLKEGK